jgi:hypothetical protein
VCFDIIPFDVGTCLDAAAEDRRVSERIAVLERVSADTDTFWSDPQRRKLWFGYKIVPIILRKLWRVAERLLRPS